MRPESEIFLVRRVCLKEKPFRRLRKNQSFDGFEMFNFSRELLEVLQESSETSRKCPETACGDRKTKALGGCSWNVARLSGGARKPL